MSKVLALIPARIGSKGVSEKNLLKIGNFSLVERALFTAIGCKSVNRIIVSSESNKVINIVNNYGNYAPFTRPYDLAADESGSLEVIKNALIWAEKKDKLKYDFIVLLEPPSPFRLPIHIEQSLLLAKNKQASSVMSIIEVGDYHPVRMKKMNDDGLLAAYGEKEPDGLRRQDQSPVYIRNSAVYIFTRENIYENILWGEKSYGYLMDSDIYSINIDEPIDVITAKAFYNKMKRDKNDLSKIEFIPLNKDFQK